MDETMTRLLIFLVVIAGLVMLYRFSSRPKVPREKNLKLKPIRKEKTGSKDDFWVQVYDTDSADEAKNIRLKFLDIGLQCFIYEQGKKDVYGNTPKHFGISVPRQHTAKAQSVLAETT